MHCRAAVTPFTRPSNAIRIRNMNVFERMHGIFDLAARPLVGVAGHESVEFFDGFLPREGTGGEPRKILNLVLDHLTVL